MKHWILASILLVVVLGSAQASPPGTEKAAQARDKGATEEAKPADIPKPESSVTQHSVTIGGQPVAYIATAGTLILRDEQDTPMASMGYVAYVKSGVPDPSRRPITFAFNGGPGSSSIWLHMGALGPRRVLTTDAGPTPPPPYGLVDNQHSILDVTDLVLIDPVGTGVSRAVGKKEDKDFWGTDPDIASVGQFIFQYVTDNDRWNSPKFLLGESYGTTRSAGLVDHLQTTRGMAFNGVILVSLALDIQAIFDGIPGNEQPYPLYLPTFAAVAWYHRALPERPDQLEPFLDEVRRWAMGPYAAALLKGDALSESERESVAGTLHRYTGLSVDYLKKADLRVREGEFTQELLRNHRETVGRLDARFTGFTFDQLAQDAQYDPQSEAISSAFTGTFLDYYYRELKASKARTYVVHAEVWKTWDWKHKVLGTRGERAQPVVNTGPDLARALGLNPNLRVLALNGYFDLATPFLATEYMLSHLRLSSRLASHIESRYYPAGHMMYLHEPSLVRMKADIAPFITAGAGESAPRAQERSRSAP
jgi:carboxypeptidase C (cathepsin A)